MSSTEVTGSGKLDFKCLDYLIFSLDCDLSTLAGDAGGLVSGLVI